MQRLRLIATLIQYARGNYNSLAALTYCGSTVVKRVGGGYQSGEVVLGGMQARYDPTPYLYCTREVSGKALGSFLQKL